MGNPASLDDFRRLLTHRLDDAVNELTNETNQIWARGAHGRVPLECVSAANRVWRGLVDTAVEDARNYTRSTEMPADALIGMANEVLTDGLRSLREASRMEKAIDRLGASAAAAKVYEAQWSKLAPYLDLQLRHFELGIGGSSSQAQTVTYSINANTINAPIQQGSHGSNQTVTVSGDTLMAKLEATIESEVAEDEIKQELIALVRELSAARGTPEYLGVYQRFMAVTADHVTVLAPFLPALAQLLTN